MKNVNHMAVTIEPEKIKAIEIYDNRKKHDSILSIKNKTKCDYIINGSLYNMKNLQPLCHLKIGGDILCKPNYKVYGYSWNDVENFALKLLPTDDLNYIACTPLIIGREKIKSLIYNPAQGGIRGRTAIGVKQGRLGLYVTRDGKYSARSPEHLRDDLYNAGWESAVMLDSGGSSQGVFKNETYIYTGRTVSHCILIYLKKE